MTLDSRRPSPTRIGIASLALSAAGMVGIAGWEQYRDTAYLPTKDDVATIGWGETKGVKMGDKTTPDRALAQLLVSTQGDTAAVKRCVTVPLYQYEFDAYVSLTYNIGAGNFCGSTLVKKLNAGDYTGACQEILKWDKQAGKQLAGLTRRRETEYRTCMGPS